MGASPAPPPGWPDDALRSLELLEAAAVPVIETHQARLLFDTIEPITERLRWGRLTGPMPSADYPSVDSFDAADLADLTRAHDRFQAAITGGTVTDGDREAEPGGGRPRPDTRYGRYRVAVSDHLRVDRRLRMEAARVYGAGAPLDDGRAIARLRRHHYDLAMRSVAIGRLDLAYHHLRHASAYDRFLFTLAAVPPGDTVPWSPPRPDLDPAPETEPPDIEGRSTGPVAVANHRTWLDAVALALWLDEATTLDQLARFAAADAFHLRAGPDPAMEAWVALYQAIIDPSHDLDAAFDDALAAFAATEPGRWRHQLAFTAMTYFEVLVRAATFDQEGFGLAVAAADDAHRHWSHPGDPRSLVNLHTAAMVTIGAQQGLTAPADPYRPDLPPSPDLS